MNTNLINVCKIGQGVDCCRYLVCGPDGFECVKLTNFAGMLDSRVKMGIMVAQGDNCEGGRNLQRIEDDTAK